MSRNCCEKITKDRVRYARKYDYCLFKRDFSELTTFTDSKRSHVLKALSGLAKFLGVYQDFKRLIKAYGLSWKTGNTDDLIISRIIKANGNNDIIEWIQKINAELPQLEDFMCFVLFTGLRYNESVRSYNLIIDLSRKSRLNEYYNTGTLEHYLFKTLFIRRTKKAFISLIPNRFVKKISNREKEITMNMITNRIKRKGFRSRFCDIREYFATCMVRYLRQPEIDFLQGRVSANVFMRNYFNPTWITDLKTRTFKAIRKIEDQL